MGPDNVVGSPMDMFSLLVMASKEHVPASSSSVNSLSSCDSLRLVPKSLGCFDPSSERVPSSLHGVLVRALAAPAEIGVNDAQGSDPATIEAESSMSGDSSGNSELPATILNGVKSIMFISSSASQSPSSGSATSSMDDWALIWCGGVCEHVRASSANNFNSDSMAEFVNSQ